MTMNTRVANSIASLKHMWVIVNSYIIKNYSQNYSLVMNAITHKRQYLFCRRTQYMVWLLSEF